MKESLKDTKIKALEELNDFYANNFGINMAVAKAIQLRSERNVGFPEWISELLKVRDRISSLTSQIEDAEKEEKQRNCVHPESDRQHNPDDEPDRCELCGMLNPQPEQSSVPDAEEKGIINKIYDKISDDLIHHVKLCYFKDDDDNGFPLVDLLSGDHPDISQGIREIENIVEQIDIDDLIKEALKLKAQSGQGKGFDIEGLKKHLKEMPIGTLREEWKEIERLYPSVHSAVQKPSDAEIDSWVKSIYVECDLYERSIIAEGAKAMRDGQISNK